MIEPGAGEATRPRAARSPVSPGVLLVRAGDRLPDVRAWAARGVVPVTLVPVEGWVALVPSAVPATAVPYRDAALLLAARAVPLRQAPALGFFVIENRAVLTVHRRTLRARCSWVVWDPARGVVRPHGLPLAGPTSVAQVAAGRAPSRRIVEDLRHCLTQRSRPADRLLAATMAVLDVPGIPWLADPAAALLAPGAESIEPAREHVARFDSTVRDAVRLRQELIERQHA